MILIFKKRTLGFMGIGILLTGLSFGAINMALHPHMNQWKQEKIVVTMVETSQKAVALTFDDGPNPEITPMILDSLKKYNAQATFFIIGNHAEKQPQLLKNMAEQGHEIGNHSYSHSYSAFSLNKIDIFQAELHKTANLIEKITSQRPVLFRPPGGYLSDNLVDFAKNEQLIIAYWTWQQDSKDWQNGNKAASIADHIIKNINPGQIILLHDGTNNSLETAKAVDIVLDSLTREGYRFVTVSDLIKLANEE
ncbi:MAG: polysaccharide deacetylase family protein [Syntrophomonas sp.]|nr:polysaccharide deacetylase family protein [Syntrophomonas sp.]